MTTNLKRYLVFAGDYYYPSGGWSDFMFSVDDVDEIKSEILRRNLSTKPSEDGSFGNCDWIQVIDTQTVGGSRARYDIDNILSDEQHATLIRIANLSMQERDGTLDEWNRNYANETVKIDKTPKKHEYTCLLCGKLVPIGSHSCSTSYKNGEEVEVVNDKK